MKNNNLNNKVAAIRSDFIKSLPRRISKIDDLTKDLINAPWDPNKAKTLMYEVHNLRGFSGSHGLLKINELSGIAENIVESLRNHDHALSANEKVDLQTAINNLIRRMEHVHDDLELNQQITTQAQINVSAESPLILIVDDDHNFCETISVQLEQLGYKTKYIYDLVDLEQSISHYKPDAIFMDIIFNGNRDAGLQTIKSLRDHLEISSPIIYMSARDDIQARLDAVRSGGVAFLCKTFSLADLKSIVDVVVPFKKDLNFKVLIIDDDKISSEYCSAILEHAGIKVYVLDNPLNVFEYVINFDPDVILLDMYMPSIDGFEMASIIRQHQSFASIPIVIMSSETDINKQFRMRRAGADDFILKPFKPHHLVDTVLNRIQRSRHTKRMIYTDGLTGLMLFPKVKDQVYNLMDSCLRYNLDFSVALIDMDYFKQVNDKYGHLAGDQILREFSEFLLARVRKSDMVTRYGGEEFAIVFPYTNAENTVRALNSIREAFSRRLKHSNVGEFHLTFSAGIASVERYQDLDSLLLAADRALYKAKEAGRNVIELAP